MDIRLPGEAGGGPPDRPGKVVMLTSLDDELVVQSIRGAVGYVLSRSAMRNCCGSGSCQEAVLDPSTTARLLRVRESERRSDEDAFRDLSEREMDVLAEVARGKTNAEVGQTLNLSEKTVRNYVSSILEKLQLNNRIELATYAVKHRISDRIDRR
jgi:DNA-binding NarL/FixJ family response regulator